MHSDFLRRYECHLSFPCGGRARPRRGPKPISACGRPHVTEARTASSADGSWHSNPVGAVDYSAVLCIGPPVNRRPRRVLVGSASGHQGRLLSNGFEIWVARIGGASHRIARLVGGSRGVLPAWHYVRAALAVAGAAAPLALRSAALRGRRTAAPLVAPGLYISALSQAGRNDNAEHATLRVRGDIIPASSSGEKLAKLAPPLVAGAKGEDQEPE